MRRIAATLALAAGVTLSVSAETRSSLDFDLAALEREVRDGRQSVARAAAELNLADILAARGDADSARRHYRAALEDLEKESLRARESSDLALYARAMAYSGLASAKLGRRGSASRLFEESLRYASDAPAIWNVIASGWSVLEDRDRGVAAARSAVILAEREGGTSSAALLDLNVYRYALASALAGGDGAPEAEALLRKILSEIEGPAFDRLRRQIADREQFEVLSAARGDAAAYIALEHRARLRLARIAEAAGRAADAREIYRAVLVTRSDDPTALAGLARLGSNEERLRHFAAAFEANPFSPALIQEYEAFVRESSAPSSGHATTGAAVREVIERLAAEDFREALDRIAVLRKEHPENATLRRLSDRATRGLMLPVDVPSFLEAGGEGLVENPAAEDLRSLARLFTTGAITPSQRAALDALRFRSVVTFAPPGTPAGATTRLMEGTVGPLAFRFPAPTEFRGTFDTTMPLLLEYRVAGVSSGNTLVLEPLGVSRP